MNIMSEHVVKYKCHDCLTIVDELPCPNCGSETPVIMCPLDHPCTCFDEVHDGIAFCPMCQESICPQCGSHDVAAMSRVTGYIQDIGGWNIGKRQELKDRVRVHVNPQKGAWERVNGKDD